MTDPERYGFIFAIIVQGLAFLYLIYEIHGRLDKHREILGDSIEMFDDIRIRLEALENGQEKTDRKTE